MTLDEAIAEIARLKALLERAKEEIFNDAISLAIEGGCRMSPDEQELAKANIDKEYS